jgi:leucyl-tRNA synthetase
LQDHNDRAIGYDALEALVVMLSPITPHVCHELWLNLDKQGEVVDAPWPQVDNSALVEDEKLVVVQVNGKVRGKITVAADATQEDVEKAAFAESNVTKFVDGLTIRKVIFIKGKLLNVVAN